MGSCCAPAGYQDLSDFGRGVIIGAREMGHDISKVAMKSGFSRTTISRVYREYRYPVNYLISAIGAAGKKTLKNWIIDVRRESLNEVDVQHFHTLPGISMMGHLQVTACELFNGPSLIWVQSRRPIRVPLLTARHKV
ncbi:hypothetical protein AVEN_160910-1 [Araneus ventricosus]|uniref:Tc3 transposase DNA binding domain-containing protein n=1 Tax=Araneus ventricosus TaxID=182803 RepID=A0A4Y2LER6_ARAVE|nr:hypothetical protein AVEN_41379-1 [Araneus ventricosus]GBN13322.1 hypothetical protein AVEN_160910-1 [Araneus ventricosus]